MSNSSRDSTLDDIPFSNIMGKKKFIRKAKSPLVSNPDLEDWFDDLKSDLYKGAPPKFNDGVGPSNHIFNLNPSIFLQRERHCRARHRHVTNFISLTKILINSLFPLSLLQFPLITRRSLTMKLTSTGRNMRERLSRNTVEKRMENCFVLGWHLSALMKKSSET